MIAISEFINKTLDADYSRTAGRMLLQVTAITNAPNSPMQRALKQLDEEAKELAESGERLKADNAALNNALIQYEQSLETTSTLMQANDNAIQETGQKIAIAAVTAKVFRALADRALSEGKNPIASTSIYSAAAKAVGFTIPSSVSFAGNYVDTAAWLSKMEGWGSGYAEMTRKTILNGLQNGWSPIRTAQQMRLYAQNIPKSAAENLTRTLQLTSYRDANRAMELVNGDYIEGKIRIASLDDRTCLSCISLHGTPLKVGERVDDHYRGRCDVFYIVPGGARQPEFMQADSLPGQRNFVPYQKGEDWFTSLPASRQAMQSSFIMSPAKLNAYKSGVSLSEFSGEHTDDVFGRQTIELSLKRAIGESKANEFYTRSES